MGDRGPGREIDEDEILAFIYDAYGPVVGTADIEEHFGVSDQTVRNYMDDLKDADLVDSRQVGRATAWWLTTSGERRVAGRQSESQ